MRNLFFLGLILVFVLSSCKKEDVKDAKVEQGQKIWYKGKSYTVKTTLDENGQFTTAYMPDELKVFYDDSKKETVTHVFELEKGTIMCLYDTEKEFKEHTTFDISDSPNRAKILNGATVTTYSGGYSINVPVGFDIYGNPIYAQVGYVSGTPLRASTNSTFGKWHFNSNEGYAFSLPWVGNTENDNIEGIKFERTFNSESTQFMGCKDVTWGGSKIWITNNVATSYEINLNQFGFGNKISSYEYFQINGPTHGINF